jgi:hypothetical protein
MNLHCLCEITHFPGLNYLNFSIILVSHSYYRPEDENLNVLDY